jgi:hypothetical protein
LAILLLAGCTTAAADDREVPVLPDRTTFPKVADLLDHRCGTLDCHGTVARNLRLYGSEGLRLSTMPPVNRPTAHPTGPGATTAAEYDEDFLSVVGLEPEILSEVISQGGANPERLTLVRKARGTEHHKGLAPFTVGDPQDRCLTSWLSGHTDTNACDQGKALF